jgi:hypothetical protein
MNTHRSPVFGALSVVAPVAGYFFVWRIASDKAAAQGDYTGLAVPLTIFIWYAPCLLLSSSFGVISLIRRETPKWVAWTGVGIAWAPVILGYIRTHLR